MMDNVYKDDVYYMQNIIDAFKYFKVNLVGSQKPCMVKDLHKRDMTYYPSLSFDEITSGPSVGLECDDCSVEYSDIEPKECKNCKRYLEYRGSHTLILENKKPSNRTILKKLNSILDDMIAWS